MITFKDIKNPVWANKSKTKINCEVNFDHLSEEYVPFTASREDSEQHGRDIFIFCSSGQAGKIGEYVEPKPTTEQLEFGHRTQRNLLLAESDWTQLSDVPQETKEKWSIYRQQLRDITKQSGFPNNINWPSKPR